MKNDAQPTILLVDDTLPELKALISFLEDAGFRILVARNGEETLERLKNVTPDIILLDIRMPGMNGFDVCRRVKEDDKVKDIPVIFMSALSETIDKITGLEAGGVDYITKPLHHEEVLARINTHLMLRKFQRQLQQQNIRLEEQNVLLEEQNLRFQTLSDATFEGILLHEEGQILELNQTAEKMFGYPCSAVLGKNLLEFVAPESHQQVLERIQTRNNAPFEANTIKQDGTILPVEIQARTMPYQRRRVRVVAVRDLSWQKRMEERQVRLQQENITLKSTIGERYKFGEIIGKSPVMQHIYESIVTAAAADTNILLCGESGTGKELVARTIHQKSVRVRGRFVPVNCGAVPEALFEREFFGHRKGAFTGATTNQPGYFDRAHKGTVFLD